MVLPGATHAVPDSHACTVGGLGALAFGCGTTELEHMLATQVIALKRPKRMRARLDGRLGAHVGAKDVALRIIAEIGVAGAAVMRSNMPARRCAPWRSSRLTLCNLAIEMGGRSGFVAPDDTTFSWIAAGPTRRRARCGTARSPPGAPGERSRCGVRPRDRHRLRDLEPQITWGTDPSQVVGITGRVPDPAAASRSRRAAAARAFDYMGLRRARRSPGCRSTASSSAPAPIAACPTSRSQPRWCAAGTSPKASSPWWCRARRTVKREAEAAGLDRVFRDAGFFWGESGCSMCAGGNGDRGEPGERCVSTTNRNFENRQGEGAHPSGEPGDGGRGSAVAGRIVDVRRCWRGWRDGALHAVNGHRGAAPASDDINTDQITPIQHRAQPQARLMPMLFHAHAPARRRQPGSRFRVQQAAVPRRRHPGDRAQFRLRLLARERGVGMLAVGIRVIVAKSFADIYRENCLQNGVLPVVLGRPRPKRFAARVIAADGAVPFTVDLVSAEHQRAGRADLGFEISGRRPHAPARRPRRHRPDPQARGRDRRVRSSAPRRRSRGCRPRSTAAERRGSRS